MKLKYLAASVGAAVLANSQPVLAQNVPQNPIPATAQSLFPAPPAEVFRDIKRSYFVAEVLLTVPGGRPVPFDNQVAFLAPSNERHPQHPLNRGALSQIVSDINQRAGTSLTQSDLDETIGRAATAANAVRYGTFGQLSIYIRPKNSQQTEAFHYVVARTQRSGQLFVTPYEQPKPIEPGMRIIPEAQLVYELSTRLTDAYSRVQPLSAEARTAMQGNIKRVIESEAPTYVSAYGRTKIDRAFGNANSPIACAFSVQANVSPQQDRQQNRYAAISGNVLSATCAPTR